MAPETGSGSESKIAAAWGAGRVRLRTLVLVRWMAIAGQAATLLVVGFGFGIDLPLGPALGAVASSAVLNLWLQLYRPLGSRLGDRAAAVLLGYDVIQLAVLLFLTGGLQNPFSLLMLAPITVSATVLSRNSTIALCALAIVCASVLGLWSLPLAWPEGVVVVSPLHVAGMWVALATGAVFIAIYAGSVAAEARRMSDALGATQLALAREQRRAAVGALAAAAAHELGSPLSTIAVVAREIARDLPRDGPLAEDAALLLAETMRCREILARLAARPEEARPEEEGATPFSVVPVTALVEAAGAPHRRKLVALAFAAHAAGAPEPQVARLPEVLYGLGSLIQNAVQFARSTIEVSTRWDDKRVEVTIADDGPGFALGVLDRLGEPYLSTRAGSGRSEFAPELHTEVHMGLGVFIAATLLERTGAALDFRNREEGGALVTIAWERERIEYRPSTGPTRPAGSSGTKGIAA